MPPRRDGWAAPLPRRWGDRTRAIAAPALLVLVASLGAYRSATIDQSSWQGASFGMFATYDNRSSRAVTVTVEDDRGERRVALPADLRDHATRLRVVPRDQSARALAEDVLRSAPDDVRRVRVELWHIVLEGDLTLRVETLATGSAAR